MKLHNTLTRQVEELELKDELVQLYSCGPTVYDYAHLGNLRAYVFTDTLRRVLELGENKVKHVMNITDVGHLVSDEDEGEDKMEKGAKREGKSVWEISEHYTEAFKRDAEQLNILPPNGFYDEKRNDQYARATDFVGAQIDIVKILMQKEVAYQTTNAIYFDINKFASYGELTGQKLEEKEIISRPDVVFDKNKRNSQDFALWFFCVGRFSSHSMRWPSPWGDGFPGWHLECSAIIHSTLHETIDIHTGGVDHIGTHHSNEIAQSEAAFDTKLSRVWVHNEHILADGKKMSKNLGNIHTLNDVIERGYHPLALRMLFLQSHYRTQTNFTWNNLEAAQNRIKALWAMASRKYQPAGILKADIKEIWERIRLALEDDLNTPLVLAEISQLESLIEKFGLDEASISEFTQLLEKIDSALGLDLLGVEELTDGQERLLKEREAARRSLDWQTADKIRKTLVEQGIEISDTDYGQIWNHE